MAAINLHDLSLPELIHELKSVDSGRRFQAMKVIAKRGKKAMPARKIVIEALSEEHQGIRKYAAISLRYTGKGAKEAIPGLKVLLDSEDAELRAIAAFALQRVGTDRAVQLATPALTEVLSHEDIHMRRIACNAFYRLGNRGASAKIELLEMFEKDRDDNLRKCAALALSRMETAEIIPTLLVWAEKGSVRFKGQLLRLLVPYAGNLAYHSLCNV